MTIPPSLAQPSFSQAPIETTDPNAISKTIMDAKGDLISATGADTPARLAVGTDGQVLLADSTQTTGLRWAADPTTTAFDAKGDLLVGTGPDAYTRVPVGTNNQVLVADSAEASGVRWSSEQDPNAITKSIIDAKGDLIAGTAADTPARLAVGSDGQYLIADSTQTAGIKWATPNITLGTETTGNYVAGITGGTGVTVTGSGSEGATPSVAIGQAVGTGDTVAFGGLNVDSGTLYVDSTNNRVGINDTTPSYSLDVTGDGHFSTDLTVDGILYANHIHGEIAGPVYIHVKNTSGSTIANGTPVYISGTVGSTQVAEIAPADASNAAKMPAIGLTDGAIAHNATGHVVILGALDGQDTSGSWQLGDHVYVASGGGRTRTRPTGTSDIIQCVGHVGRLNANTGEIIVNAGSVVSAPNSISIPGNIETTAGQFTGSGAGLTSIPAGQLTGTVPSTNIGNDSVALGTKTTGDYVATVAASTGVTVTGGTGEGSTATISIGQAVGTTDSPQFVGVTATGTVSANAVSVTNGVGAASATITGTTATSVLTVDGIEIDTTGASANQVLSYNGTKFVPSSPGAADANALTGTTLASNVVSSSLTSVGTLGSLAVTGDLTVDTSTLKVDSANNRVGIGTTSPTYPLEVYGNGIMTRYAATNDGIALVGRVGGTSSRSVTIEPAALTTSRSLTLPDANGTVITTGNLSSITSTGTLSSLTVTGDVTVDTNTLKVDSSNNRVGVVNASPAYALDVTGDINASAAIRISGNSIGTWTNWTPTWTSTGTNPAIGNGFIGGSYTRVGKLIVADAYIFAGSTTTYGTGVYVVSLPVTGVTNSSLTGSVSFLDASAGYVAYHGTSIFNSTTAIEFRIGNGLGLWSPTVPVTMANGDQVRFTIIYQAA